MAVLTVNSNWDCDQLVDAQGHLTFRLLNISFNDAMSLAMIMMLLLLPASESTVPQICTCLPAGLAARQVWHEIEAYAGGCRQPPLSPPKDLIKDESSAAQFSKNGRTFGHKLHTYNTRAQYPHLNRSSTRTAKSRQLLFSCCCPSVTESTNNSCLLNISHKLAAIK